MTRRKSRPARGAMGNTARLIIPKDLKEEGYVYRIVNDTPGRLDMFVEHGWEFISRRDMKASDGLGSKLQFHVGTTAENVPLKAYGMKIQQEWYDEDKLEKSAANDRVDESIRAGVEGIGNAYTPGQGTTEVTQSPVTIDSH
jgi:hypothetical protein